MKLKKNTSTLFRGLLQVFVIGSLMLSLFVTSPAKAATGVDLVVTGYTITPPNPSVGEAFTISVTIENQGTVSTISPAYRHVFFDTGDPNLLPPDPGTGCPSTEPPYENYFRNDLNQQLDPGVPDTRDIEVPNGLATGGVHEFWFYVDATCIEDEDNETNNALGPFTLTVAGFSIGPADVDVTMGGTLRGQYTIAQNAETQPSYANLAAGPVKVTGNGNAIVLSERVLYSFGGVLESYYEMMAVPSQQLSTEYWYPYSTNVGVNTQIRVGNAGNATANVEVRIAGTLVGSYTIAPNSLGAYTYYNVVGGPVRVTSTNGVPIVSTQRFIFTKDGINPASFAETMGLPATQLGTEYWFPVYNNSTTNSELRIGNAGNSSATVDIYMGGVKQGATLSIAPNTTQLVSFAGLAAGPVRIVSTNAVPIVVTERVLYSFGGVLESYYEMLALPSQQLSTEYWYPYSTNVGVNTQIRVGNAGNATANVEVRIAGTLVGSYTIAPNSLGAYTYYNVVGGPVQVTSTNGVPITSTQRFIFTKDGITPTSFAETMGLPLEQLSDEYWFPVYNNSTTNSQLRIANP